MNDFQERIGVGERQHVFGRRAGTNRVTPVVAEVGPMRGRVTGTQTEHWSGRVDACVTPAAVKLKTSVQQGD